MSNGDNNGNGSTSKGRRKSDTFLYKILQAAVYVIAGLITGGTLQFAAPTNTALDLEIERTKHEVRELEVHVKEYINAHEREEELKDKLIENHLREIKADLKELKSDVRTIKNGH